MARLGKTSAWTTFMALALGSGCGSSDPGAETTAGGGGTGATGSGTTTAASSATSSGTGSSYVCDPPAEAGSIYELAALSYDINEIDPVSMCKYRGDVMLVVNTAAL